MKYNASNYYYDGYAAQTNGLSYEQCQIEIGTQARLDWCRGWRDAESDNRKKSSPSEIDASNQQFESLATKQDKGWNGEGLPPIGCECEAFDGDAWYPAVVVGHYDGFSFAWNYDHRITFTVNEIDSHLFRRIRTDAEIMREDTKNAIAELCKSSASNGHSADLIYDAIAAGKIPNIKMESPHE